MSEGTIILADGRELSLEEFTTQQEVMEEIVIIRQTITTERIQHKIYHKPNAKPKTKKERRSKVRFISQEELFVELLDKYGLFEVFCEAHPFKTQTAWRKWKKGDHSKMESLMKEVRAVFSPVGKR